MIRRVRLRQLVLVILAGGSILFRSLSEFASIFSHLELLVPVFLSIITNSVYEAPIGEIASWCLYIYLVYEFAPRFFPPPLRHVVSNKGFRVLFSIITIVAAACFTVLPSAIADTSEMLGEGFSADASWNMPLTYLLFICLGIFVLIGPRIFLFYFGYTRGRIPNGLLRRPVNWQLKPVPKALVEVQKFQNVDLYHQMENSESVTAEEVWKSGSTSYMLHCSLPAAAIVIISALYPLPELIILIGISVNIFKWVAPTHQKAILDQLLIRNKERIVDIEEYVFLAIGKTGHTIMGPQILGLALSGLAFASLMFTEGVQIAKLVVFNPNNAVLLHVTTAIALLIAGIYGVWYWFSILLRLSSFIKWRSEVEMYESFSTGSEEFTLNPPARPGGVMVPPMVLTLIITVEWVSPRFISAPMYVITWTSLIGITIWTVWESKGAEAQPPETDMWSIPLAWAVQCFGVIVVFGAFTMDSVPVLPMLAFTLLGPAFYFWGHLTGYSENHSGFRSYADVAFLVIVSWYWFAVLFASVRWLQSSYVLNLAFVLIGLALLNMAARTYKLRVISN